MADRHRSSTKARPLPESGRGWPLCSAGDPDGLFVVRPDLMVSKSDPARLPLGTPGRKTVRIVRTEALSRVCLDEE